MSLFDNSIAHKKVILLAAKQIKGLSLHFDFISQKQELLLLQQIEASDWLQDLSRRVQHYGYKYDYRARKIDKSFYLGELPDWLKKLAQIIYEKGIINFVPDQAIINEYNPGQGIASHIDCEPCFGDTIITLSLGSDCVMEFRRDINIKEKVGVLLPQRCLAVMTKDSRYNWLHGISKRKKDHFNNDIIIRKRRVSITFRKVFVG